MATTILKNLKEAKNRKPSQHLQNAINYILNPDKTENGLWVGSNCGITSQEIYDAIHFLRREMLDFTAFPVFFVSNLLLVQRKKYYFNRATVSRNCSIVL